MTVYEEQLLLDYLGCNPDKEKNGFERRKFIDGIDGDVTKAARASFAAAYGVQCNGSNLIAAVCGALGTAQETAPQGDAIDLSCYLESDGKLHIPKGANIRLSRNFTSGELECQCSRCKETVLSPGLPDAIQRFRDAVNMPVYITSAGGSGYRCEAHNAEVGGAANSLHTLGLAADLHCPGLTPYAMKQAADRLGNWGELGMYSWGIHLGTERPDGAHARWDSR